MQDKIKIGISHGDTNGIGYEVILKALSEKAMLDMCTPIIYGSKKVSGYHKKSVELEELHLNYIDDADKANHKKVNLIPVVSDDVEVEYGKPTNASGKAAFDSLNAAVEDLKKGKIHALVTAPINKFNIQSDSFNFPGHTEFLKQSDGKENNLMFMISENLKVGVVTGHIPLKDVASAVTKEKILGKIKIMNQSLKQDFNIRKPKIAVLGLNPHAGDNGLLGKEDIEIVKPAIEAASDSKILAYGPFAADGFFGSAQFNSYDAILGMYHDQGLIPFKALSFGTGVNYTAGLSFVRTSPDHGTGYDIAGKNSANPSSFRQAIYSAIDIVKSRMLNKELLSNPLPFGLANQKQFKDNKREVADELPKEEQNS